MSKRNERKQTSSKQAIAFSMTSDGDVKRNAVMLCMVQIVVVIAVMPYSLVRSERYAF